MPGRPRSLPEPLGLAQRWLLLAAEDPVRGRELFRVDPGASGVPYGHGCTAPGDVVPTLRATDPVLGGTAVLTGRAARSGSWVFPIFGVTPPVPGDIGGGCLLYTHPTDFIILGPTPTTAGAWSFPVPIPNFVGYVGLELAFQAVLGPSPAVPNGFDMTNGVLTVLGR
jgi:hypothetical protein